MRWIILAVAVAVASPAAAGELRNPDVPFGWCAIDLYASRANNLDWTYSYAVGSWQQTVETAGAVDMSTVGVGFVFPFGARATLGLSLSRQDRAAVTHGRDLFENLDGYSLGFRLRLYPFGN